MKKFNYIYFYLKHPILIEVAYHDIKYGISSNVHIILNIKDDFIKILEVDYCHFVFEFENNIYIYWCDVDIFTKFHVMSAEDFRDNKLNKILDDL